MNDYLCDVNSYAIPSSFQSVLVYTANRSWYPPPSSPRLMCWIPASLHNTLVLKSHNKTKARTMLQQLCLLHLQLADVKTGAWPIQQVMLVLILERCSAILPTGIGVTTESNHYMIISFFDVLKMNSGHVLSWQLIHTGVRLSQPLDVPIYMVMPSWKKTWEGWQRWWIVCSYS